MDRVSAFLGLVWGFITNSHNLQITGARRFNIRFVNTNGEIVEAESEATKASRMMHLIHSAGSTKLGHDRLRHAAWRELRAREVGTQELLIRIKNVKERQVALLQEASHVQQEQLIQLNEISTELWNAWQLCLEMDK